MWSETVSENYIRHNCCVIIVIHMRLFSRVSPEALLKVAFLSAGWNLRGSSHPCVFTTALSNSFSRIIKILLSLSHNGNLNFDLPNLVGDVILSSLIVDCWRVLRRSTCDPLSGEGGHIALPGDLKYCHPLFRANVRFINAGIAAGGNYRQVLLGWH